MPTKRITWRDFSSGLFIRGPRENNPPASLRRAKGVAPLRGGSIRSRSGSALLFGIDAHSLFRWNDTRLMGQGAELYRGTTAGSETGIATESALSGQRWTAAPMAPTVGAADYLWLADPSWPIKLKSDFTNQRWGIAAPTLAPTSAVKNAGSAKAIDNFDTAANWTANLITGKANDTVKKLEGTGSLTGSLLKDVDGTLDRTVALDLSQFAAPGDSADDDYIELSIAFSRPKHVKNVEIVFIVGAAAPANFDNVTDSYSRELSVKVVERQKKKKLLGTGDFVKFKDQAKFLADNPVGNARDFSTAEFIKEDKIGVKRRIWTRLTIPRSTFEAHGRAGQANFTWANVQGIRISIETTKQGGTVFWLDNLRMIGGVGMTGDYKHTYTYKNSVTKERGNPPMDVNGNILFILTQDVERQSVTVSGFQLSTDPQVDKIEVWRTLGNGELYFLAGEVNNSGSPSFVDTVADYVGMFSGSGGTPTVLQPIELPVDNIPPPTGIFDCAVAFGRMFAITNTGANKGRLYYSPAGRPGSVGANFLEIASADEPIERVLFWNGSVWALTNTRWFQVLGTDDPFVAAPVGRVPGVRDGCRRTVAILAEHGIAYQANDGVRIFDGTSSHVAADDALRPIMRNAASDGIAAFIGATATAGRNEYYISDVTNTTLAFDLATESWRNIGLGCNCLFYEDETDLLLGVFNTATFSFGLIPILANGAAFTMDTAGAQYTSITQPVVTATAPGTVYVRMPIAVTLTDLTVKLAAALGGGGTVTFKFFVNGSNSAALNVVIASGASTGTASGTLALAQDDLVCIHAVFAGGSVTCSVTSMVAAYKVAIA